jgi:hypothetical protein
MVRNQNWLHLSTSFNVPFVAIPCFPALSSQPLGFRLHEIHAGEQMVSLWISGALDASACSWSHFAGWQKSHPQVQSGNSIDR